MGAFGNWNRYKDTANDRWTDYSRSRGFDRDPDSISEIPEDISKVFVETDIEKVWLVLEKTFRVNIRWWKDKFEEHFRKSTHEFSKEELFVRFGKKHLEPPLNILLARKEMTPTWLNIIRYVVRDKIREKEREADAIRNYYKRKK